MLENLNDRQYQAVVGTEGPMLILAGAGSGKTKVLTTKLAYLIKEKGVSPYNILAITFTNKAAKEMKDRVKKLIGDSADAMWIGTFHSISVRILRMGAEKLGYTNNFTIYDRDDQKSLLKEIYKEEGINDKTLKYNTALAQISKAKNEGIGPDKYFEYFGNDFSSSQVEACYKSYEKKKKAYNAFDFDDLIIKALELLELDESLRTYFQKKFSYVFVDEYQDTNRTQYQLVRLISDRNRNITVVGDADQSIYGWRGADINNILDFEKDFKGSNLVLLEENYRSTSPILEAANKIIKNNKERKEKNLWTAKEGGEKPKYFESRSEDGEPRKIVELIQNLTYDKEKLSDMAILYRTNGQSRAIEEALVYAQIPYVVVGGLKFYDRKEIKDLIAYLRLIVNDRDNVSLKRVINEPKRGIGPKSIEKLEDKANSFSMGIMEYLNSNPSETDKKTKQNEGLKDFISVIEKSKKVLMEKPLSSAIIDIFEYTGIVGGLKKENTIEAKSRLENIEALVSSVAHYEASSEEPSLEDYLATVSLMSDVDKTDEEKSGVSLMTVHAAKGLEFPIVFITGMEEGLFPSKFSIDEDNVEEERRLFYVAITRAERKLYISSSSLRRTYGSLMTQMQSRFIDELGDSIDYKEEKIKTGENYFNLDKPRVKTQNESWDRSYLNFGIEKRKESLKSLEGKAFVIGDRVKHKKFGSGMVVQVTEEADGKTFLVISFENNGVKKLRQDLAPLERIDG